MANVKISALPAATTINDTSVAPFSISGTTDKVTWEQIRKWLLDRFYPVGTVFITSSYSTAATVASALGGGTWAQEASGRTIMGYNSGDGDFNSNGKTAGTKTHTHSTGDHTLTVAEMPSHTHTVEQFTTTLGPSLMGQGSVASWAMDTVENKTSSSTGGGGAHNHGNTGSTNGMPPYVVRYIWRRTA